MINPALDAENQEGEDRVTARAESNSRVNVRKHIQSIIDQGLTAQNLVSIYCSAKRVNHDEMLAISAGVRKYTEAGK